MTERLYYHDSHTTEFDARVLERPTYDGHPALVLDRTYFYPTGGGQPHDTGVIGEAAVIDVLTREDDHAVVHVLDQAVEDETVICRVDWPRRLDHMQHHTGQHILTQAFVQIADAQTVSFHLGADVVTIDLDKTDLTPEVVAEVEALVNRVIFEDRPVTVSEIDPAEADHVRMRRMPGQLLTDGLRVIQVQDFDTTACGGTHVARTGEIGLLKILRLETRGAETRVEFICGQRALADYGEKHRILTELAADLTTGYWEVPDSVAKLQSSAKDSQKALKQVTQRLLEYEKDELLETAEAHGEVRVIKAVLEHFDGGDLRGLASSLIEAGKIVVMLGAPGDSAQIIMARSGDLPYQMNTAIQAAFAALGSGRGGGRPDFVQGGGSPAAAEALERAFQAAEKALFESGE